MSHRMQSILRLILYYIVFSALWILFSDWVSNILQQRYNLPAVIETIKGLIFVLVSGGFFYWLLYRELKQREQDWQGHMAEKERLIEQVNQKNQELLDAYNRTIAGWSLMLEKRNREVKDHSRRVTELTVQLAEYMGIQEPDLSHIRRGAMLHDIGKMAIEDAVIQKNGDLTEEDRAIIRRHPLFGFEMLSEIEYLRPALDILLCHHEKWNGEGYPFGLAGEQIPLFARIFSVVDVYDALTSQRTYRSAITQEQAAEYLREESGQHFDPRIVETFLEMLERENEKQGIGSA
jgi:putative nucleotidyltransferase with HDIG domain